MQVHELRIPPNNCVGIQPCHLHLSNVYLNYFIMILKNVNAGEIRGRGREEGRVEGDKRDEGDKCRERGKERRGEGRSVHFLFQ